jgi:hypothetical protein
LMLSVSAQGEGRLAWPDGSVYVGGTCGMQRCGCKIACVLRAVAWAGQRLRSQQRQPPHLRLSRGLRRTATARPRATALTTHWSMYMCVCAVVRDGRPVQGLLDKAGACCRLRAGETRGAAASGAAFVALTERILTERCRWRDPLLLRRRGRAESDPVCPLNVYQQDD